MRKKLLNTAKTVAIWIAFLFGISVLWIALVNFILFPACNRDNRDCFLIERMW